MSRMRRTPAVVTQPRAIQLLASPLRQRIVDLVALEGPQTVAGLSRALRRPADRLYYHVKQLVSAGLLLSTRNGVSGDSRGVRFDVPGRPLFLHYAPGSAANRRAVIGVANGILRAAQRDFRRTFAPGIEANGPRRRLWTGRVEGHLAPADVEQLNALLTRALELVLVSPRRRSPHALPHQLTWVSSPRPEP
jgi:hypothetical protein